MLRLLAYLFLLIPLHQVSGWGRPGQKTNVIVIVADTLRADHLSSYGYSVKTSPNLDEFSSTATLYAKTVSVAPWTLPAHASMFTGLFPVEHGAHTYHVKVKRKNARQLSDHHITLAEVFRDLGYETAAIGANKTYVFNRRYGLQQGFQTSEYIGRDVDDVNSRVMPWIRENHDKPFFLFINYMDTHRPYNLSPRPGLIGRPIAPDSRVSIKRLLQEVMGEEAPAPEELVQTVIDQYDTAVANLDAGLAVLFSELRDLSLFDDALILFTSDHGEYFGEHRLVEHSKDIYQEALSVPLIVKQPCQASGSVDTTPISSVDLPHIVLSGIGILEKVRKEHPGLFPYSPGAHPVIAENYYTRRKDLFHPIWGKRFNRVRRAWYESPYKYIASSDGQHELYDLRRDPKELKDVIHEQKEQAKDISSRFMEYFSRLKPFELPDDRQRLDKSEIEALTVRGHPKAASEGHFKTGHFQEPLRAASGVGCADGQYIENGKEANGFGAPEAGLVVSSDRARGGSPTREDCPL